MQVVCGLYAGRMLVVRCVQIIGLEEGKWTKELANR